MTPAPRVALVTGSTSGIGAEIARRLSRDGFTVVVTGRSRERGQEVLEQLTTRGDLVISDLTSQDGPAELLEEVVRRHGRVDVLVNNAATDHTGSLLNVPAEELRATFENNAVAPIRLLQAVARSMVTTGGGSIVNITSRLASAGVPSMGVYSAAKGALEALTRTAAVELAGHRIRVNAVAPGLTRTPLYDEWIASLPDPVTADRAAAESIPLGRIASPEDVAAAVAFLASPAAAYITGVSLPVDGGFLAK